MMTFMNEKTIDLYLMRSEDYLDDTKVISEDQERSFNVKINFIKRELEEKAREAEII